MENNEQVAKSEHFVFDFKNLTLSDKTRNRIEQSGFTTPTDLQSFCLASLLQADNASLVGRENSGKQTSLFIILSQLLEEDKIGFVIFDTEEEKAIFQETFLKFLHLEEPAAVEKIFFLTTKELGDETKKPNLLAYFVNPLVLEISKELKTFFLTLDSKCKKIFVSSLPTTKLQTLNYLFNPSAQSMAPAFDDFSLTNLEQNPLICDSSKKFQIMLGFLKDLAPGQNAIIYTNGMLTSHWLKFKLEKNNFTSLLLDSEHKMEDRLSLEEKLQNSEKPLIVLSSGGRENILIFSSSIKKVINFDTPLQPQVYSARVTKYSQCKASIEYITLICDQYGQNFFAIKDFFDKAVPVSKIASKELLETEDLSANPFEDPEFSKIVERFQERPRPQREFTRSYSAPRDFNKREITKPKHFSDNRNFDDKRGERRPYEKFDRNKKPNYNNANNNNNKGRYNVKPKTTKTAEKFSFWSLVKKVVSFFVPKKK